MEAYITGLGSISVQNTFEANDFLQNPKPLDSPVNYCIEPDYKKFIQPIQLRRMGRILRMGVTAAAKCLKEGGVDLPDAIITGTGLGMVQDTEKFLTSVIENEEKFLNPTSFIQSTHNTVCAHIAVMLKCNHYNFTYVHSSISFESALLDSLMQVSEHPEMKVLLGGLDEMTDIYFRISDNAGLWNKYQVENNPSMDPQKVKVGEGASFFLLTGTRPAEFYARFTGMDTFYKPACAGDISSRIAGFLQQHGLDPQSIDFVLSGQTDQEGDIIYRELKEGLFKNNNFGYYKHLCGEYYTSPAFAAWIAAKMLKNQIVPDAVVLRGSGANSLKHVLIWNHFRNINHSLILLSA